MDVQSITRWEDYSKAKDEMFVHTDIPEAPWFTVESEDKRRSRMNVIAHLLSSVPYEHRDPPDVPIPERPPDSSYERPPREQFTLRARPRRIPRAAAELTGARRAGRDSSPSGRCQRYAATGPVWHPVAMIRWVGVAIAAVLIPIYLAVVTPGTPAHDNPAAQRAFDAVVHSQFDPARPTEHFPKDYEQVMGYVPKSTTGPLGVPILYAPRGDCSGPTGPTEYDFELVCQEHDLAYDVIRYAYRVGAPLPVEMRQAADQMFESELHATCTAQPLSVPSAAMCHTFAQSFAWAVMLNSWRQSYRPPENEDLFTLFAYCLFFVGVFTPFWVQRRRSVIDPWAVPMRPAAALWTLGARGGGTAQSADLSSH